MKKHTLLIFLVTFFLYACRPSIKITEPTNATTFSAASKKLADTIAIKILDTIVNKPKPEIDSSRTDSFMADLLKKYPQYFDNILKNRKAWNVQIIYTQISRNKSNNPSFEDYYFNVDSTKYYYPASSVKLPIALLALQKLNELSSYGWIKQENHDDN